VLFDQPQQMSLRNLIFQAEVVEQSFGAVVLPPIPFLTMIDRF